MRDVLDLDTQPCEQDIEETARRTGRYALEYALDRIRTNDDERAYQEAHDFACYVSECRMDSIYVGEDAETEWSATRMQGAWRTHLQYRSRRTNR